MGFFGLHIIILYISRYHTSLECQETRAQDEIMLIKWFCEGNIREVVLLPQVCYLQALSDVKRMKDRRGECVCVSVPAHRDGSFAPQKYLSDFIY